MVSWDVLYKAIHKGELTPFIGSDVCIDGITSKAELARQWAKGKVGDYNAYPKYPMNDTENLSRVAQFLAVQKHSMFPKELMAERLSKVEGGFTSLCDEMLAELPLPVYVTTRYDNLLEQAIEKGRGMQMPTLHDIARWDESLSNKQLPHQPTEPPGSHKPVVFHLFGQLLVPESIVITEDDHLKFLVKVCEPPLNLPAEPSEQPPVIPNYLLQRLPTTVLVFLGFQLFDLELCVLLRFLDRYLQRTSFGRTSKVHVAVQLSVPAQATDKQQAQEYMTKYFEGFNVSVVFCEYKQFLGKLCSGYKTWSRQHATNEAANRTT